VYPKSEVAKKALSKSPSIDSTSSKVPKISQIPQSICVFVWFFSHDPSLEDGTVISAALTARAWWQVQRTKRSRQQPLGVGLSLSVVPIPIDSYKFQGADDFAGN
jgi:hypothetical protein